ncbi:[acyl-carrier-protein] S-malonyltransferase [Ornithinimicrobium humiphilum]|uniref:[acyl-carrier-protein] S-malonyltransferase n=1 Tax=Ornithinimicrobium humiphilum TaxID=125288 RepID=A0A543KPT9_9MICO|nr:[acyl-carrier-protein] S-malonyltransferase [Ornithinimicrobium humiphilum]
MIVAPGQGSQTPGFLSPWLELPGFRDRMGWLSAVAGMDLVAHGTTSDAETIKDTAVAQPLIVGAGLVSLLALFAHPADGFRVVGAGAGHSVGEITAASAAGVLSAEQAMVFVRERGRGMAEASAMTPTGMTAVVGGDPEEVAAALERHGLTPANMNGAGQVVAAGTLEQLAALRDDPPARARVIPLQVAGAFHTSHMQPAVDRLAAYSRAISTHDPRLPLVSNADGTVVQDGREVLRRLVSQVSSPVRWDLTMETFADMGVTGLIEIPPAGTLAGLAKRALKGVETLALKTPDDLEAAHRMIREHGAPTELSPVEASWSVVVSPVKGAVTPSVELGGTVAAGDTVATVATLRAEHPVVAAHGGRAVEWLVAPGDPVSPGQPLLRLYPEEDAL